MAESSGDGGHGLAGIEQQARLEVAEVVQSSIDPDAVGDPPPCLRETVRRNRSLTGGIIREDEGACRELDAAEVCSGFHLIPVVSEEVGCPRVERDRAHLVGLGVLLEQLCAELGHRLAEHDESPLEVDIRPAQAAQLAPPAPGGSDQAEHQGVLGVL